MINYSELAKKLERDCIFAHGICECGCNAAEASRAIEALDKHVEVLQDKISGMKLCACSYDYPDDVCACHSPMLRKAQAEITTLGNAAMSFEHELKIAQVMIVSLKEEIAFARTALKGDA